jgi:4-oxalocrotonate tautomerase
VVCNYAVVVMSGFINAKRRMRVAMNGAKLTGERPSYSAQASSSVRTQLTPKETIMPFVNIKLMDGVFSSEQKHAMAAAITDVMVKFEGSEAFREVVWVLIEELHTDGWHIGGLPFMGPKSIMDTLGRSKKLYESIEGHPATRAELLIAAPVIPPK